MIYLFSCYCFLRQIQGQSKGYTDIEIVVRDWFKEESIIFIPTSKITIACLTDSHITAKTVSES